MSDEDLVRGTAALSQPIRVALYRHLVQAGAAGSGPVALAEALDLQRNLVSYHLQPLVAAGLVLSERRGRDVNYRVEPSAMKRLASMLLDLRLPHSGDPA